MMNKDELEYLLELKESYYQNEPIEDPYRNEEYKALRGFTNARFNSKFRESKKAKITRVNKRKLRNRERRNRE